MTNLVVLQNVGNGLATNDGTGDPLRAGAAIFNNNHQAAATAINRLASAQAGGTISFLTKADMDADLNYPDGQIAWVTNDSTVTNNQAWRKSGSAGTGSWETTIDRLADVLGNGSGFMQDGGGAVVRTYLSKAREEKSIQDFGAIADGATDIAPAISKAVTAGIKRLRIPAGAYKISSSVEIGNLEIYGDGPGTVIDATTGTFASNYVFTSNGSLSALPELASDAIFGDRTVTFSSAPGLSPGDIFCIHDPATSSWSGFRDYYYAGEWCEVVSVVDNTVNLKNGLYEGYAATSVNVFKLSGPSPVVRDMTINAETSFGVIYANLCRGAKFINLTCTHAGDSIVSLNRCIDCEISSPILNNYGSGDNDYGISVGNSQHIKIIGGNIYSRRHAIVTGGSDISCAVPCRDIKIIGATMKNDIGSGVESANFHGNAEACYFIDCTSYSGFTLSGRDVGAINCIAWHNSNGVCYVLSEVKGGVFDIRGGQMRTFIDPQTNSRAIVDCGRNVNTSINASTVLPLTLSVKDVDVFGRNLTSTSIFAAFYNRGSAAKCNVVIDNVRFNVNALSQILIMNCVSGSASSDYIIVDRIAGAPAGTLLANIDNPSGAGYLAQPLRMQRQSGVVSGITAATTEYAADLINLRYVYPRIPNAACSVRGVGGAALSTLAGQLPVPGIHFISKTSIRPNVQAVAAFAAGTNFELSWVTEISET